MKNILIYYLSILLPIPLILWAVNYNSILFTILLLLYSTIYRGFTDGQRLLEKRIIVRSEFWKSFIPFWSSKYFRQLYFEK
jgi:hypothetical protein